MRSLSAGQLAILAGTVKAGSWVFDVADTASATHYWSTKNVTCGGQAYTFKIINFSGITLARPRTESGIMPPSELTFSIINTSNLYEPSDFENCYVTLHLFMGNGTDAEVEIRAWKFLVKKVEGSYQQLDFTCEDFFAQYVEGDYPGAQYTMESVDPSWLAADAAWLAADMAWSVGATGSAATFGIKTRDIFPSVDGDIDDDCCLPLPFGTCYVPIRSVYIPSSRFYVLGPTISNGASVTYDVLASRTPREYSTKVEYLKASYSFTQYTKVSADGYSFLTVQPMVAGGPAVGVYANGDNWYDVPMEFTRSDTAIMTNPSDIIKYVLQDMGVAAADIDATSFASAASTYYGWGLKYNGAFWHVITREKALTLLLSMCHATINVGTALELSILDSRSKKTITEADIIRSGETGAGTFKQSMYTRTLSQCGNVSYSPTGDAQDIGLNLLVSAENAKEHIDPEVFEMPFVQDVTLAERIAGLYLQRKLLKKSEERMSVKSTCLALDPGDFITISGNNYGGTHDVIVDSIAIKKDLSCDLICSGYSGAIGNYPFLAMRASDSVRVTESKSITRV
jgi:hypothetical protein